MNRSYRFGEFVLDPRRRSLSYADSDVSLTPKAFDVLLFLAQNPNRVVTKDELMEAVWGDTFVEEGNLKQYISHLRKALGDNSEEPRLIVTIPRKGYQFTERVTVSDPADIAEHSRPQVGATESPKTDARSVELGSREKLGRIGWDWFQVAQVVRGSRAIGCHCCGSLVVLEPPAIRHALRHGHHCSR